LRRPITGLADCCARAADGDDIAGAIPVLKLRRFIGSPEPAPAFADYLKEMWVSGMEVKVSLRSSI
jgi:hypothetical protein